MEFSLTGNDAVVVAKSPPESDPKRTNTKPLSFTNGVLKRQRHHITDVQSVVVYKECLKNHAAALGGHALDGCGEFMPDRSAISSNPSSPISLKCAACGCHRNFHRREPEDSPTALHLITPPPSTAIEYQPHHQRGHQLHHHQQPLPLNSARPSPPSPPPISSSYYPSSAPHMLLALSTGLPPPENMQQQTVAADPVSGSGRKRFRTKFSSQQKEKMYELAERVGWKMQKRDEELVNDLCNQIGVGREVFKVWMHNNKSTFNKRSADLTGNTNKDSMFFHNGGGLGIHQDNCEVNTTEHHSLLLGHNNLNADNVDNLTTIQHQHDRHHSEESGGHVTTNGSFSSP